MKKLSEELGKIEIGRGGTDTYTGQIRADEFLPDLKGCLLYTSDAADE